MLQFQSRNNSVASSIVNAQPGIEIKGRTLVNLIGKDGNCEDKTKWGIANEVLEDVARFTQGSKSFKTISNASAVSYVYKDVPISSPYALIVVDMYPESYTSGMKTSISAYDLNAWTNPLTKYIDVAKLGAWQKVYLKVNKTNGIRLAVGRVSTGVEVTNIDAVRVYEIDQATYNKIDVDPEYTGDKLAQKFPYVDSVQFKTNTMVTVKSKNLIPSFNSGEWTLHANTVVNSDYNLTLNATTTNQNSNVKVNVKPLTTYTFKVESSGFSIYDFTGDVQGGIIKYSSVPTTYSFTTSANCSKIVIFMGSSSIGTFNWSNPQLELGSTATSFEPQIKTQAHTSIPLASDESIFVTPNLQLYKQTWQKNVQLTGDLAWIYNNDFAGFKQFYVLSYPNNAKPNQGPIAAKYNGSILPIDNTSQVTIAGDRIFLSATPSLNISVLDVDSGWTDAYTPTAAEIKAYFYGWKMCASDGSAYVSGTKYWKKITDGTGITSTCPTASYAGYTPYTMHYQFATPQYYVSTYNSNPILTAGSTVNVPNGPCQIEQQTGIDWSTKSDMANKYASTVDVGTQVDNPTVMPMYQYRQQFNEQNVGYFNLSGMVSSPVVAVARQGRSISL